jgi:multiple sugar transport system permease protein
VALPLAKPGCWRCAVHALLVSIPVGVTYAFGQRFLAEGLTAGAVKG